MFMYPFTLLFFIIIIKTQYCDYSLYFPQEGKFLEKQYVLDAQQIMNEFMDGFMHKWISWQILQIILF